MQLSLPSSPSPLPSEILESGFLGPPDLGALLAGEGGEALAGNLLERSRGLLGLEACPREPEGCVWACQHLPLSTLKSPSLASLLLSGRGTGRSSEPSLPHRPGKVQGLRLTLVSSLPCPNGHSLSRGPCPLGHSQSCPMEEKASGFSTGLKGGPGVPSAGDLQPSSVGVRQTSPQCQSNPPGPLCGLGVGPRDCRTPTPPAIPLLQTHPCTLSGEGPQAWVWPGKARPLPPPFPSPPLPMKLAGAGRGIAPSSRL